jgi:threonine dehydrogenase-like Zn-dependent dehydrogenase
MAGSALDIVFPSAGEVALEKVPVPVPGPGEVLCRAQKSLISRGTETFCLRGEYDKGTYWEKYIRYPFHPGYSMVARVEAVGDGVEGWRPGDRVSSWAPHRQYFTAPQEQLFPVPDAVDDIAATWATLARTTQLGVRRAQLELGESVGVVGLGILGQLVIQYLRVGGARRIVAIDTSAGRLERARLSGATDLVQADAGEAAGQVSAITGGAMLDVVFDITGHPAVLAPATLLLRKLGRLVLLGDSPTPSQQHLGPRIVGDSLSILGMHGFMFPEQTTPFNQWTAETMTAVFFDLLLQGRMDVGHLLDRQVSPETAPELYRGFLTGGDDAIGIILDWTRLAD